MKIFRNHIYTSNLGLLVEEAVELKKLDGSNTLMCNQAVNRLHANRYSVIKILQNG